MDKAQIIAALAVLTWNARIDRDPSFKSAVQADNDRAKRNHVADIYDLFDEFVKVQLTFD